MRRFRTWAAGLSVLVVLGLPAPAEAGNSFVIANTASDLAGPVPRGARLSLSTAAPVILEDRVAYEPWTTVASGGLYVEASCRSQRPMRLPITSITRSGTGHRIDVYYPNSLGAEPFGACDNFGDAEFKLQPADGFGSLMGRDVVTVQGHPGIFSIGLTPNGSHIEGLTGKVTPLSVCASIPSACPVRTSGHPATLQVQLTGAEMFVCQPCHLTNIFFDLAPAGGAYQTQTLISLVRVGTGIEEATIGLGTDLGGGEYRLRVRNSVRPEMPEPLTVFLGAPV